MTYIHTSICEIPTSESLQCNTGASAELHGGLEGWHVQGGREVQEREGVCAHMDGSLHSAAEANTPSESNHAPIKKKKITKMRRLEFGKIIYDLALH